MQKRRKDQPSAVPLFFVPAWNALFGTQTCSSPVTGAPVRAYSVLRGCCCSEFTGSAVLMPRTYRHFSESASPATTLRHRISNARKISKRTVCILSRFFGGVVIIFLRCCAEKRRMARCRPARASCVETTASRSLLRGRLGA